MTVEDPSPLRVSAMIASSDWARQLSAYGWVDGKDNLTFHVGRSTADEIMKASNSAQAEALRPLMQSDASTAIAAVATLLPSYLHLFVTSGKRRLALWQNEPGGPLGLLQFVPRDELQQFPDEFGCPLGHSMPTENKAETLDDHFRVSPPHLFDPGARRYENQLETYFALPDQLARTAWLDNSHRGIPGSRDEARLDTVYVPGGEFLRCTARCGYYKWSGSWLRDKR